MVLLAGSVGCRRAVGAVVRRVFVIIFLAVAGVGCAAQPTPRPSDRPSGAQTPTGSTDSPAALVQAADGVLVSDVNVLRGQWTLFRAQQLLVAQCMRDDGETYLITDPGPEPGTNTSTAESLGTGTHLTYGLQASPLTSAQDAYVRQLSEPARTRYDQALGGPANEQASVTLPSGLVISYREGGCLGQARSRLFGSVQNAVLDSVLPQDVDKRFGKSLTQSARYKAALADWRACMARAGYTYVDPTDAINQIRLLLDGGTNPQHVGALEQAVADVDAVCDHPSRLRQVRAQELDAFLRGLPLPQLVSLADVHRARLRALDAVNRGSAVSQ